MKLLETLPPAHSRKFKIRGAGIIVAIGQKICLQRRTVCAPSKPGMLAHWGGEVERGESIWQGGCRELGEELGIKVRRQQLLCLGAHTYDLAGGKPLAGRFFLGLPEDTELNCREGAIEFYDNVNAALNAAKLDPHGTTWSLKECARRGLIPV